MNQSTLNHRILSFDVLRIIAAFAVILLHVSGERFYDCFPSDEWEIRNIYDSIVRWGVPIFVMISGALFLNQDKKISIKKIYSKSIIRIIYIFIFWSFCYALYGSIIDNSFNVLYFLKSLFAGPLHLWFLKMLIGLYIAVPFLRAITKDKRLEEYFIFVAVLTAFIIPSLITAIGLFNESAKEMALKYYNVFGIKIASGYVGYFVLGHYLYTYQLSSALKKFIYPLGLLSVIFVIILTHWYSHYAGEPCSEFYDNLNIFTLFESMTVFMMINQLKVSANYSSIIVRMSNLSLGIYLIHMLVFRMAYNIFGISAESFSPYYFIPCFSLIVFVTSGLIVSLLKKIPIIKIFLM